MDTVRILNDEGVNAFRAYLGVLRSDTRAEPPRQILYDGNYSDPLAIAVELDPLVFPDAFALGEYLVARFSTCEDRIISRNHALWNWLALYFFDTICRPSTDGTRKPLEDAVYLLESRFSFRKYYRHGARTPWLAVREHGSRAKILLLTAGRGSRSDIAEQLGAYQHIFQSKTVIDAAYRLYFDDGEQRPKRGAGGKGAGSARRLAAIVQQLELTYDLEQCPDKQFDKLLPMEFSRWIKTEARPS
jgi:hypothetical protein